MKTLRYEKENLPTSYNHEFHAGNIGDVWKHLIWIQLIREAQKNYSSLAITDTHAGRGSYLLKGTGEWLEGAGKIYSIKGRACPNSLSEYTSQLAQLGFDATPRCYPGSPQLCASLLREKDSLTCFELDEGAYAALESNLSGRHGIKTIRGDGPGAIQDRAKQGALKTEELILIDPPFAAKREWLDIPLIVKECFTSCSTIQMALWYPIKSYTRVNEMHRVLREAKIPTLVLELITTPLHYQRNRLNGSGVLVVNPSHGFGAKIAEAAAIIGETAAILPREWEVKILSF